MEIKICSKCGSIDTSLDCSTNKITCLKCGDVNDGKLTNVYRYFNPEEVKKPDGNPFQLKQEIVDVDKKIRDKCLSER